MTLPNHLGAYGFEIEHFDRAIDEPLGIRVHFGKDSAGAKKFQLRMHQARSLDRQQSRRMYPVQDIRSGASIYDPLIIRVREDVEGDWWVYVDKHIFDPNQSQSVAGTRRDAPMND